MRRLLYSLVFVSVLLLAGYAALAGENEPSGGGTVPGEEHQVWLPVVGREVPKECLPRDLSIVEMCSPHPIGSCNKSAFVYFPSMNEDAFSEMIATVYPVLATEPDFTPVSIIIEGLGSPDRYWYSWNWGYGLLANVDYEAGQRYYARLDYQCKKHNIRWEDSDIAPDDPE